jgi:hypothetical protein
MKRVLVLLVFLTSTVARSQPPDRFYTKFGGIGDQIGYSAKQTLDGNYIVAGNSSDYLGNGRSDLFLIKVNTMGVAMWERYIGGIANEIGKSVIQLPDSGFVVTGFTNSSGSGGYDVYTVRTDKIGLTIWEKTFGGASWDFGNDVVLGSDNNIYVTGYSESFGAGKRDGFVIKYDLLGNLLDKRFYGGLEDDELRSIIRTKDGFLATTGITKSGKDINGDFFFQKLNNNLDTLFTKIIGGPFHDSGYDLIQNVDSNYILSGAKTYSLGGKSHSYLYTMDSKGKYIVDTNFRKGNLDEHFVSICNSNYRTFLKAAARSVPFPDTKMQAEIVISYPSGFEYMLNDIGNGYENEFVYSIEATKDQGYLMVGSTESYNSFGKDLFFVKLDTTIVNYNGLVNIKENNAPISNAAIYLHSNELQLHGQLEIEQLKIFNVNGEKLTELEVNSKEYNYDMSEFPPSIYIIQIVEKNGFLTNKKLVLIK